MAYPENPKTIVVRNKYYPKGLTELDIWNYYQSVKGPLLRQVINRDLMFYIMVDLNKPVIRRKVGGKFIRLTQKNYDEIITGRTVSIHSAMGSYEEFGIIDIDVHPSDGFAWSRKVTKDVYEFVMDKIPVLRTVSIRYTGKTSFHIVCDFGRKAKIDSIKFLLNNFLSKSDLSRVYQIGGKRRAGVPNLDLDRNCLRCNYITLHSLSIFGLKCMEVPYQELLRFNQTKARI
jgi:hypothetical protein